MKPIIVFLLIVITGLTADCKDKPRSNVQPANSIEDSTLTAAINQFTFDLYGKLDAKRQANIFFSPFSIATALTMTYGGARGETALEMANALHIANLGERVHPAFCTLLESLPHSLIKDTVNELALANGIWVQQRYPFVPAFLDLVKNDYAAVAEPVDFLDAANREAARLHINKWVEERTRNNIKNLLNEDDLTSLNRAVLCNAIYFYGRWEFPFDTGRTKVDTFTTVSGGKVAVPMMHMRAKRTLRYTEDTTAQILELPYADSLTSLVIILPRKGVSLADVEQKLSAEILQKWTSDWSIPSMEIGISLPRFKIDERYYLKKPLKELGIQRAFDGADFTGISPTKELYISNVIHQAMVEVNEQGTKAVAATAVTLVAYSMPRLIEFSADHPFVFMIRHKSTGAILFMGRVASPTAM